MSLIDRQHRPLRLPPLYPLVGSPPGEELGGFDPLLERAGECLRGGARLLQLREKPPAGADAAELSRWQERTLGAARRLARLCARHQALLIVNDFPDWVIASGAGGVHLGQDDSDPRQARRMLGPEAVIGYSTHDERQFRQAQELPIDYVALGPIFNSPSKPGADPPLGLQRLRRLASASRLPVVAIGGITLAGASDVWNAGAGSIALISGIFEHPDPASRVRDFLRVHRRLRPSS